MKSRMHSSALLKQEFLKKWIKGLNIFGNLKKNMTVLERKKAIKLSADVAIASTRNATTHWSRALMASVSRDGNYNKILIQQISSGRQVENKSSIGLITCSKKILKRSRIAHQRARRSVVPRRSVKASLIAKKLVKNKTRVLKSLVPGGEQMDGISLIKETIDYIVSLRVQVDVMQHFANAADRLILSKNL